MYRTMAIDKTLQKILMFVVVEVILSSFFVAEFRKSVKKLSTKAKLVLFFVVMLLVNISLRTNMFFCEEIRNFFNHDE